MNAKSNESGKVGYTTYLVLISLQCLGLPLSFLISPPSKVIRPDGTKVDDPTKREDAGLGDFKKIWKLLKTKYIFLLLPLLVGFNWNNTYQGIYLTFYFSVRARALGSFLAGVVASLANIFWGWFFDYRGFSRRTVAKSTWGFFLVMMLAIFSWQVSNEKLYYSIEPRPAFDWESPGFGRAFAVHVLFR